jgi:hypothetical protein
MRRLFRTSERSDYHTSLLAMTLSAAVPEYSRNWWRRSLALRLSPPRGGIAIFGSPLYPFGEPIEQQMRARHD